MPRVSNRREIIIDVATHRFLISGYDVVTVDEICELTSSTKGSFYHFFTNKESLAIDVINHVWNLAEAELEDIFANDTSPIDQLTHEIERISGNFMRHNGKRYYIGCPIGTLAIALRGRSPRLTRRLNFALTHMKQFYQESFEAGIERGEITLQGSASDMADRYHISGHGLSSLGKASPSPTKIRDLSRQLLAGLAILKR